MSRRPQTLRGWFLVLGALLLAAAAGGARADVVLRGLQHIGDNHSPLNSFFPHDAVTRLQMRAYPSRFHLTQTLTVTAVVFSAATGLDDQIVGVYFDGVRRGGVLAGQTYTLNQEIVLSAGLHTVAPDPGCLPNVTPCVNENDIAFGSLILVSPDGTNTRMLSQRRNVGDNDDDDDNYDIDGGPANWYPDPSEGAAIDIPFEVTAERRLDAIHFYRLRDLNSSLATRARVLVDGLAVGELTADGDPFRLPSSLLLGAGNHVLRVESGADSSGDRDTISWDDILLFFSNPLTGIPGSFNVVDSSDNAVNGRIRTKVAGTSFTLDMVALNQALNAQLASFEGTLSAQLLDADDDGSALDGENCRASWTTVRALGTYTMTGAGGRVGFVVNQPDLVLRKARVRVTDLARNLSACSRDAFAIRPASLSASLSNAGPSTPGTLNLLNDTGTGGTRTHRAGQPLTAQVSALNSAGAITPGYDGNPVLAVQQAIQGSQAGSFTVETWSGLGTRRSDTVRYSEAGTFSLAVSDPAYADVDLDDTAAAQRVVPVTLSGVGRFTPDHFRPLSQNAPQLAPGCTSFSYLGQPLSYALAPQLVLEAVNASGARTLNYTGQLMRLPAALPASSYRAVDAASGTTVALDTSLLPSPDNSRSDDGGGLATIRYEPLARLAVLRALPQAPFDLKLALDVAPIVDGDGITTDPAAPPLRFGSTETALPGIAFSGAATQLRYGRLFLENAYGSERASLDITFGTEYALAGGAFARNLADACSTPGTLSLAGDLAAATSAALQQAIVAGRGTLRLAAPNPATPGTVSLRADPAAWLRVDLDGDGLHTETPVSALATFGSFRAGEQRIYQRETYR